MKLQLKGRYNLPTLCWSDTGDPREPATAVVAKPLRSFRRTGPPRDRCGEGVPDLEAVGLDGDDLDDGHLHAELLRELRVEAA